MLYELQRIFMEEQWTFFCFLTMKPPSPSPNEMLQTMSMFLTMKL